MGDRAAGKLLLSALGVGAALLLWHLFAVYTASELILPTPGRTLVELFRIASSPEFPSQIFATLFRGVLVLLIIVTLALPLGLLSGHYVKVATVLTVPVAVIRSTPVISIILLALIWFPSGGVPVFAAILMGFPLLYENIAAGMRSVDREYLEVARAFRLGRPARLRHVYLPAVGGYLGSGMRSASGIVWKVVVAAEVLSQPSFGIGARLQESRIYLETAGVFGWTVLLIVISVLFDYILRLLSAVPFARIFPVAPGALPLAAAPSTPASAGATSGGPATASAAPPASAPTAPRVTIAGGRKRYDETLVFDALDMSFAPGGRSVILGPSGCGKTTLLRVLAGLEQLDEGEARVLPGVLGESHGPGSVSGPGGRVGPGVVAGGPAGGANAEALGPASGPGAVAGGPAGGANAEALGPASGPGGPLGLGSGRGQTVWRRAYAFQEPRLLPWLTVREHLTLVREPRREYRLSPERIIELLGLREFSDARPVALSGGMRQRLGLARALAVEAPLLLLDEPFSALDVDSRRRLHAALKDELLSPDQTVIAVTHDIHDAVVLGDRLYLCTDRPMRLYDLFEVTKGSDPGEMAVEVYRRMVHAL